MTREEVIAIINAATKNGHAEGMEGVEFTPEMLAGCAIFDAACENEFEYDVESEIGAQADLLLSEGAEFNKSEACEYALKLFKTRYPTLSVFNAAHPFRV